RLGPDGGRPRRAAALAPLVGAVRPRLLGLASRRVSTRRRAVSAGARRLRSPAHRGRGRGAWSAASLAREPAQRLLELDVRDRERGRRRAEGAVLAGRDDDDAGSLGLLSVTRARA